MRNACIKIYSLATQHKGVTLGIGVLAAAAAVKTGVKPDMLYRG